MLAATRLVTRPSAAEIAIAPPFELAAADAAPHHRLTPASDRLHGRVMDAGQPGIRRDPGIGAVVELSERDGARERAAEQAVVAGEVERWPSPSRFPRWSN